MNSCAMLLADREARDLYVAKLMRTVTDELVAVAQDPKAKNYFDSQIGQIKSLNLIRTKIIHQIWQKQQNSDLSESDVLSILLGYAGAAGESK
ncbi:MAG: hypothetical protein AB7N80_03480 [Bdellovibrionales bacterium]